MIRFICLLLAVAFAVGLAGCAELPAQAAGLSSRNLGGVLRLRCTTPCASLRPSIGAPLTFEAP